MEENRIDYPKKIAEMEALIEVLKNLKETKVKLSNLFLKKVNDMAERLNYCAETVGYSMEMNEYRERRLQYEIDIFSLDAEIETKEMILKNYIERSERDEENTAIMAEKARKEVPDRIKRAKQL